MKIFGKGFVPAFVLLYLFGWMVTQPTPVIDELVDEKNRSERIKLAVPVKNVTLPSVETNSEESAPSNAMKLTFPSVPQEYSRQLSVDSLPTLNIPQLLAGLRHATSAVDPFYMTQTQDLQIATELQYVIFPLSASTATSIALRSLMQTGNTNTVNGGGHGVAMMGYFQHTQFSEYPLGIAVEAKCDNVGFGTLAVCVGFESQLSGNNGSMTFVGFDAQITSNMGNLFSFTGLKMGVTGNTQVIPSIEGIFIQDIDKGSGEVLEINGFHFKNQTLNNALVKRAIWIEDPEAVIETVGPIKAPGLTVQTVNEPVNIGLSGTEVIPADGTRPQNHEGTEFMTVVITPKDPGNILRIEYEAGLSTPQGGQVITALFQDSAPDTLDAKSDFILPNTMNTVQGSYEMVAGTTSPITFSLRAGLTSPASLHMNTIGGLAFLGDSINSYLRVTERNPG